MTVYCLCHSVFNSAVFEGKRLGITVTMAFNKMFLMSLCLYIMGMGSIHKSQLCPSAHLFGLFKPYLSNYKSYQFETSFTDRTHLEVPPPQNQPVCLSVCLSIHACICVSICVSVCVQNTSFCQITRRGIKSHLVTALVWYSPIICCLLYKHPNIVFSIH